MIEGIRLPTAFAALALVTLATGCDDSATGPAVDPASELQPGYTLLDNDTDIALGVESDHYAAGAEVKLVLSNQSGERVGFNLCFHEIERNTSEGWVPVEGLEGRICTLVLHMIDSGETAQYGTSLPEALSTGEYRFRVALHLMDRGEFRDQASSPFQVEG